LICFRIFDSSHAFDHSVGGSVSALSSHVTIVCCNCLDSIPLHSRWTYFSDNLSLYRSRPFPFVGLVYCRTKLFSYVLFVPFCFSLTQCPYSCSSKNFIETTDLPGSRLLRRGTFHRPPSLIALSLVDSAPVCLLGFNFSLIFLLLSGSEQRKCGFSRSCEVFVSRSLSDRDPRKRSYMSGTYWVRRGPPEFGAGASSASDPLSHILFSRFYFYSYDLSLGYSDVAVMRTLGPFFFRCRALVFSRVAVFSSSVF